MPAISNMPITKPMRARCDMDAKNCRIDIPLERDQMAVFMAFAKFPSAISCRHSRESGNPFALMQEEDGFPLSRE
jgi:hypothetical protein